MIVETLVAMEKAIASCLSFTAKHLQQSADTLSSAPVSATFTRVTTSIFGTPLSDLSGPRLVAISAIYALSFVFSVTFIFRYFNSTPELHTVPPPAARYDPDIDPQSDSFCDEDVKPQLLAPSSENIQTCINPSTGQIIGHVQCNTPSDVKSMIARAKVAQLSWNDSSFQRRRLVLNVLKQYILYEQKSLCSISCRDTGKTTLEASLGEVLPSLEKLRWLLSKEAEKSVSSSFRSVGPMSIHKIARIDYSPIGIIAAIAPWNYPLHNIINPISASLFTGNSIIIKPSEHSLLSSIHYIRIIRRALTLCNESPDLVQGLIGGADVASELVCSDGIDKIFFTGSTAVGLKVASVAASKLVPTCLELGGKDPFIICEDADLNHALSICMRGVFQNAGQNCVGIERIFLHCNIKQQFLKLALEQVKSIRPGIDMGAMTMGQAAIDNIQSLVDEAVLKGARILIGGEQIRGENGWGNKGFYYAPTILDNVTTDMRIANEEVFGPVMSIFEWDNDEEMINIVNSCPFGLGSSIFTGDKRRGESILKGLKVGMSNINDFAANYLCQSMPFGGTKQSGSDRFAGIEGLRGCCVIKASTRDRFMWMKTRIPRVLQYPLRENATEFASEINDLIYGQSFMTKLDNLRNLLGMMLFPSWKPRAVASG